MLVIAIVGVVVTTPLGNTANQPDLIDPLATALLSGAFAAGDRVVADVDGDQIRFREARSEAA